MHAPCTMHHKNHFEKANTHKSTIEQHLEQSSLCCICSNVKAYLTTPEEIATAPGNGILLLGEVGGIQSDKGIK